MQKLKAGLITLCITMVMLGSLTILTACGGGDGGSSTPATATLSGTAATGAAVKRATVTAVNATGKTATATTSEQGDYSLTIEEGGPYLLKVTTDDGEVLYSFTNTAGRANLTQLTTLALFDANGRQSLTSLFEGWAKTRLTQDKVLGAARRINANFRSRYVARQLDPVSFNIFTASFTANGTGLDGVLDDVHVQIRCSSTACTEEVKIGEDTVVYNFSMDTSDITLGSGGGNTGGNTGGGTGGGTSSNLPSGSKWNLTVSGTVSGQHFSQTVSNIDMTGVPSSAAGAQKMVQDFGGLAGAYSGNGVDIDFKFGSLTTTYSGCGACGVGSEIVAKAKGSVTVSGTVNGTTIPKTTSKFDYVYTFKRVS